jgi:hypothetical protein
MPLEADVCDVDMLFIIGFIIVGEFVLQALDINNRQENNEINSRVNIFVFWRIEYFLLILIFASLLVRFATGFVLHSRDL